MADSGESTRRAFVRSHDEPQRSGASARSRAAFLGVDAFESRLEPWAYQELLHRTKPEVIIACDVARGGVALYLAGICDLLGSGAIIGSTHDPSRVDDRVGSHSRVTLIEGSTTSMATREAIREACRGRRAMVLLDLEGRAGRMLQALRLYAPLVATGCHLVCKGVDADDAGGGPPPDLGRHRALRAFLAESMEIWEPESGDDIPALESWPDGIVRRTGEPRTAVAPLVSVIVPCFNAVEWTRLCVDALARRSRPPWELIVVDDGSTDATPAFLGDLAEHVAAAVTIVRNDENRGFAAACNQGLRAARGEYLVLLNNDVIVTRDWLEHLIALAESDATIGLTGPMSNYASPPQLVPDVVYHDLTGLDDFAARWRAGHRGQWLTTEKLSGFCLLLKRAVIESIGSLDERFGLGFFEDDDLCLRARLAGYQLAVARDLYVHHFGSQTFLGAGIDAEGLLAANEARFRAKWGDLAPASRRVGLSAWSAGRRDGA